MKLKLMFFTYSAYKGTKKLHNKYFYCSKNIIHYKFLPLFKHICN